MIYVIKPFTFLSRNLSVSGSLFVRRSFLSVTKTSTLITQIQHIPIRFQSNNIQNRDSNQSIPADIYEKKEVISRRIPGEKEQTNSLSDRLPNSLQFEKEAVPTLLPRPGVPAPNKYPLGRLYELLLSKKEPELIYEAEPHKLYFVFFYAFALVFLIYGMNVFNIGYELAFAMYEDNDMSLSDFQLKLQIAMHLGIVTFLGLLPTLAGIAFIFAPSRLIRRIWYLPAGAGKPAYIKFTTHSYLPNRPTPVKIMEIGTLQKSITAKIYSGKGFYGTNDSSFFFFLREKNHRVPFIVDRKGFFWGDGRVFDLLFSDDSVDIVENSKKIDEVYGDLIRERKEKEQSLKKELGFGWRTKAGAKLLTEDLNKLKNIISDTKVPSIGKKDKHKNSKTSKK